MPATAFIKFAQGLSVGVAGQAIKGTTGIAVSVQNGDNTGVRSWEIELLYRDPTSSVGVGILAFSDDGTTPVATFTPDVRGSWRIRLRVWDQIGRPGSPLATDTDIRVFSVPEVNGIVLPPAQRWPKPLPTPESGEAGAKPSEVNFSDQPDGWAGDGTGDGLLNNALRRLDGLLAGFGMVVLAGDVSGPANSNLLGVNVVGNSNLRQSVALSVVGRGVNTLGNVADITTTSGSAGVLRESGGTLGFGTVATGGIADQAVTNAKLRDSVALSVIGRSGSTAGVPADIAGTADQVLRVSADGLTLGFGAVALNSSSAVTGLLDLSHIVPGSNGQFIQTVSGVAAWASFSFATPVDVGTANAAGSAATFARSDHVHNLPFTPVQTALAAASSAVSFNSQKITNVATPTSANDGVNKAYADALAAGLKLKNPAVAVAVANQATMSGQAQTIDGVALNTVGQRVLLTAQTTATQNGLWVIASGAWTRPADFATGSTAALAYVPVTGGTVYAGSGWLDTNTAGSDVVDTDNLTWGLFTQPSSITAGAGLIKTGNTIDVVANADGSLVVNADDVKVGVLATDAQHGVRGGGTQHANATTSVAGFMSAADKTKIDGILGDGVERLGKQPVRAATGANITLSGTQTIDGVVLIAGDRCLVKNQTTPSQNGIYIVASGAWARSTDADGAGDLLGGQLIPVSEGTANGNRVIQLTTNDPITIGSTALTFALDRIVPVTSTAPSDISDSAAAVGTDNSAARTDHVHRITFATVAAVLAVASASVSVNSQKITNLATPTVSSDAATKGYVDGVAAAVVGGSNGQVQYNNAGALDGASGISVVASETAFAFGATPAATGDLRFTYGSTGLVSKNQAGSGDVRALSIGTYFGATNTVKVGGTGTNVVALDVTSGLSNSSISFQIDGTQVAVFTAAGFNMGGLALASASYLSSSAGSAAATGVIRTAYGDLIAVARNNAGSGDVQALSVGTYFGTTDCVRLGGANANAVALDFATGGLLSLRIAGTQVAAFTSAGFNMGGLAVASASFFSGSAGSVGASGLLRGSHGQDFLVGRDFADVNDLQIARLGSDGNNIITFGTNTVTNSIFYRSNIEHRWHIASSQRMALTGTSLALSTANLTLDTGFLQFGTSPAASGLIRWPHAQAMLGRNQAGTADGNLLSWGTTGGNDSIRIGDNSVVALMNISVKSSGSFTFNIAGTPEYQFDAGALTLNGNNLVNAGFLSFGASPAGAGLIRTEYNGGGGTAGTGIIVSEDSTGAATSLLRYRLNTTTSIDDELSLGSTSGVQEVRSFVKTGGQYRWNIGSNEVLVYSASTLTLAPVGTPEYVFSTTALDVKDNAIQWGTNPSATGLERFPHNPGVALTSGRNQANSADVALVTWGATANNRLTVGSVGVAELFANIATSGSYNLQINSSTEYTFDATTLTMNGNNVVGAGFVSTSGTVAASGALRVTSGAAAVVARNNGNTADVMLIGFNFGGVLTDRLQLGDTNVAETYFNVKAGGSYVVQVNGGTEYTLSASALTMGSNNLLMGAGQIFGAGTTATSGFLNLAHATSPLAVRNQANSTDIILLNWGGSGNDVLDIGGAGGAIASSIGYGVASGGTHTFKINNTNEMILNSTSLDLVNNDIIRSNVSDASATRFLIRGTGSTASNNNGGRTRISGGRPFGSGLAGATAIAINLDDSTFQNIFEVALLGGAAHVLALFGQNDITTTQMPTNTGDYVMWLGNCSTAPTAAPVGGSILYGEGGQFKGVGTGLCFIDLTPTNGGTATGTLRRVTRRENRVQTTDATVTTLDTFTLPNGSVADVKAWVVGRQSTTNRAGYNLFACVSQEAGAAALVGTVDQSAKESNGQWDATIDASGATCRIRVTGTSATTIEWWVYWEINYYQQ